MRSDVVDLAEFYRSPLGRVAQRMVRRGIRTMWPDVSGMTVVGLGYATPFLRPFLEEATRVIALMPAQQGVVHWPPQEANLVALGDEAELPFADLSVDRVLLVHSVESTEQLRPMMREVWRILTANGRVVVVAPNRRGLWARIERTPFAYGAPYSASQLRHMLRGAMFMPTVSEPALFVPPTRSRMLLSSAEAWEKAGTRWLPLFGGVVIVEATKQIYAAAAPDVAALRRRARASSGAVVPGARDRCGAGRPIPLPAAVPSAPAPPARATPSLGRAR